jgi:hypothetical protein
MSRERSTLSAQLFDPFAALTPECRKLQECSGAAECRKAESEGLWLKADR